MSYSNTIKSKLTALVLILSLILLIVPASTVKTDAANLSMSVSVTYSSAYTGGTASLKVTAKGGTSPYTYKFIYKIGTGSWVTIKNYSSSNSASFKFPKAGTYTIRSYVKDKKNTSLYCDLKKTVSAVETPLKNNSVISASKINAGSSVKITAKASGGTSPYTYQYSYKEANGSWVTAKAYSSTASYNLKLSNAGYYTVRCRVKDKKNKTVDKTFSVTVTNKTGKTLTNSSSVSASKINYTSNLKITGKASGKASGGTAPYTYSYSYKAENGSWVTVSSNTKTSSSSFKLSSPGVYSVRCVVKDYTGATKSKVMTVTSYKNTGSALSNTSKLNISTSTLVEKGSTVKMQGSASGGTQPYQYAYYYKLNSGSFVTAKAYSATASYALKLSSTGKYTLRIAVKDNTGKVINKDYTVEVIDNTATSVTTETLTYGFSKTLTADDAGSGATYAFYYKKSSDANWQCISAYSTNKTASVRPRDLVSYTARIYTKKNNNVTYKDIIIKPEIPAAMNQELTIINNYRTKAGIGKLTLDNELCFAAGVRAEEMASKFSHTRPDGRSCFTVLDDYSIRCKGTVGENIASGYNTPTDVMEGWMNSDGHRANILNSDYTKVGLSVNGRYWVQVFSN